MAEFISIDLRPVEVRILAYLVTNAQAQVTEPELAEALGRLRQLLSSAIRHHRDD